MNYPVNGIDVSKWQRQIDWNKALKQGIMFAFIRASEGDKQVDTYFEHNMIQTHKLGIARGIYHFFKPGKDVLKQAELFSTIIKSWHFELDAVVDVETSDGLQPDELKDVLALFINHAEQLTGRKLMIYSSPGFFNQHLPVTDYAWRRGLWVAHWTKKELPQIPNDWINHGKTWSFWQHSAKNNGLGKLYGVATKSVGLDRFNGSQEQFIEAYRLTSLPADDPAPADESGPKFKVITTALHIFSAPAFNAPIVGDLREGDVVALRDVSGTDEVWMQIACGQWCLYAYNGKTLMQKIEV